MDLNAIRTENKDYGYRRILGELRNQGYVINKKKVQRIIQKFGLQVTSYTRKSRKYSSYKGKVGTVAPNRIRRRFNTNIPLFMQAGLSILETFAILPIVPSFVINKSPFSS